VFASIVIWGYDPFAFCELPLICVLIGLTPARRELAPDRVARDKIVLVVLARNEHLAEWIAHHLHIGVGRIHVLDDSMPHGGQGVRPSDVASGRVVLHNVTVPEGRRFFLGVRALSTPPLRLPGDVENQRVPSRRSTLKHAVQANSPPNLSTCVRPARDASRCSRLLVRQYVAFFSDACSRVGRTSLDFNTFEQALPEEVRRQHTK
jgi:hypothetical protein